MERLPHSRDLISRERMKMEAEVPFYSYFWPPPLPPGVRFLPTDEELLYYLSRKVRHQKLPCDFFIEDDLYLYHPQQFVEKYKVSVEGFWYVFTPRIRKYPNGGRPNRSAGMGYWKATGSDQSIQNSKGKKIGSKKSLSYYQGKQPKGDKTGWIMQEYRLNEPQKRNSKDKPMVLDDHILCKICYREIRDSEMMQNIPMEQSYQLDFEAPQIPSAVPFSVDEHEIYPMIEGFEDLMMVNDIYSCFNNEHHHLY